MHRSRRIFSLLNKDPPVGLGLVECGIAAQKKRSSRPKIVNNNVKDIPEYVDIFDKGDWEKLDAVLRTPSNLVAKATQVAENENEDVKEGYRNEKVVKQTAEREEEGRKYEKKNEEEKQTKEEEVKRIDNNIEEEANQVEVSRQSLAEEAIIDDEFTPVIEWSEYCRQNGEAQLQPIGELLFTEDVGIIDDLQNCASGEERDDEEVIINGVSKPKNRKLYRSISEEEGDDKEVTNEVSIHKNRKRYRSISEEEGDDKEVTNEVSIHKNRKRYRSASEEDGDDEEVIINEVSKHENGKRYRNKRHCCKFCQKMYIAISRHLQSVHKNELEMCRIGALTSGKDRKTALEQLVREGDYYYNKEVLVTGKGELILIRRPTPQELKKHSYKDYGPCTNCLGFMLKEHIWHHVKYGCKESKNKPSTSFSTRLKSEALLAAGLREIFSEEFEHWVIGKLSKDEVGSTVKNEDVLLKYGDYLFQKNQTTSPQQRAQNVRSAVRSLASILIKIREKYTFDSFTDLLDPVKFDMIVETVKEVCQFQNISKKGDLKSPSAAIRLGLELVKIGEFVHGLFIKKEDSVKGKKVKQFIHLVKTEWNTRVSSTARSTLEQRKYNSTELLPLTSDLIKLSAYLEEVCERSKKQLLTSPDPKSYRHLSEALLSRIILFNKRRSGETSKLKLSHFFNRGDWQTETNEEFKKSMSTTEQELANKLTLIYTKGKRTSKVAILLTDKMKAYAELLIEKRQIHGIHEENPYIFARPYPAETPLRGHDCLENCCTEAGLTCYERITGTKLRKYIATVTQILNLSENETDWLAKHLGHDLHVHRNFYRLHESAVELTKVSRLLLAVDQGKTNKFAGKTLNQINLYEMSDLEEEDEEKEKDKEEEEVLMPDEKNYEKDDDEYTPHFSEDEEQPDPERQKKTTNKRACIKTPWSSAEKQAVLSFFSRHIREKKGGVKKIPAEEFIAANSCLKSRSWLNIRDFVRNYIKKL